MMRKMALMAGTFVTLLVAFAVYHFSTGGETGQPTYWELPQRGEIPPMASTQPRGGPGVNNRGTGLTLSKYDAGGNLEGLFFLPKWTKQQDGSYLVEEPNAVLYHKGGQRTYVHAHRGELVIEDLARGTGVRSGKLYGDVTVWIDPSTQMGPLRTDPSRRLDQLVRIYTDEIHFDNDQLRMSTESPIRLFSRKADVYGRGLDLRWREAPLELVSLEIPHGELPGR